MSRKRKKQEDDAGERKQRKVDDSYNEDEMNTIYNNPKQFQGVMRKYWAQRHNLFCKYDEGILLTKELWFSVTPERISKYVARAIYEQLAAARARQAQPATDSPFRILDGFCGGGGNITQFLQYPDCVVYAVDNNHRHLECTKNNALVYCGSESVDERLRLLPMDWNYADPDAPAAAADDPDHSDSDSDDHDLEDAVYASGSQSLRSLRELAALRFDCVFGSPPWGGPEYIKADKYNLDCLQPFDLTKMLLVLRTYSEFVCLFLPKNIDIEQLVAATREAYLQHPPQSLGGGAKVKVKVKVVHMFTFQREKGVLVTWSVET